MNGIGVVQRWWDEVWGHADVDPVDELVAATYVRHGPSGTVTRSREELKDDLRHYFRVLHKPQVTIHDQALDGDRVWTRLSLEGVNLETEQRRVMSWLQVNRIDDDGRIAETWFLYAEGVDWG